MTTFADDVKMVLAEVAPELATRITESRVGWARMGIVNRPPITRNEYGVIDRAKRIVAERHGRVDNRCVDCRWAVFVASDPGVVPSPCPHIEETT